MATYRIRYKDMICQRPGFSFHRPQFPRPLAPPTIRLKEFMKLTGAVLVRVPHVPGSPGAVESQKSSHKCHYPSDHLGVVMNAKLFRTMEVLGVMVDDKHPIFTATAPAKVCTIALEDDIEWLLP